MKKLRFFGAPSLVALASLAIGSNAIASPGSNFPFEAPPNGLPGECFARVMTPAQYETVTEQVVVDEGGARIQVSAPQFAAQSQQYTVRDAGIRYEVQQPTYRTVTEQVMVRPGYQTLQVVPGEYRTVTEQVQVSPPRLTWKPGASLASRAGVRVTQTHQGAVYCLVEEPGEVQNVSKRVQVRAESVRAIDVPPVYQNITRQVMVDPGGVREIPIPAQYGSLTIQQLVQPAGQTSTAIAPRMGSVSRRVQISDESFSWVKVLCETNATPAAISEVQTLLHNQGFYHGQINGNINRSTEAAIGQYQQQMHIPHGGFLSLQTIDSLRAGHQTPAPIVQSQGYEQSSWSQSAPAQYSYQSSSSNWSTVGSSSGWSQAGADQQVYADGQVISRIPVGERPTGIIAGTQGVAPHYSSGAQQWHSDRFLSWSGK
ncbi:MAG: hypothetical protein COA47_13350 [Robiginitomaculum sp.]|nr:MAG: hypothetical protein COA47_13350 [Robiginitomaculum sp.]